jgi:hypothetical protein
MLFPSCFIKTTGLVAWQVAYLASWLASYGISVHLFSLGFVLRLAAVSALSFGFHHIISDKP